MEYVECDCRLAYLLLRSTRARNRMQLRAQLSCLMCWMSLRKVGFSSRSASACSEPEMTLRMVMQHSACRFANFPMPLRRRLACLRQLDWLQRCRRRWRACCSYRLVHTLSTFSSAAAKARVRAVTTNWLDFYSTVRKCETGSD